MRYLVRARVKSGCEERLLKAIDDGSLGRGSVAEGEYLRNMKDARLSDKLGSVEPEENLWRVRLRLTPCISTWRFERMKRATPISSSSCLICTLSERLSDMERSTRLAEVQMISNCNRITKLSQFH